MCYILQSITLDFNKITLSNIQTSCGQFHRLPSSDQVIVFTISHLESKFQHKQCLLLLLINIDALHKAHPAVPYKLLWMNYTRQILTSYSLYVHCTQQVNFCRIFALSMQKSYYIKHFYICPLFYGNSHLSDDYKLSCVYSFHYVLILVDLCLLVSYFLDISGVGQEYVRLNSIISYISYL